MKTAFEQRILPCNVHWLNLLINIQQLPSQYLSEELSKQDFASAEQNEEFRTIIVFKADGHILLIKLRSSYTEHQRRVRDLLLVRNWPSQVDLCLEEPDS